MYLSAVTLQLSKYMAGAITVAVVITMDGVEAITMDGAIIIVGETSLWDHSERSRLGAAFSLSRIVTGMSVLGHKPTWAALSAMSGLRGTSAAASKDGAFIAALARRCRQTCASRAWSIPVDPAAGRLRQNSAAPHGRHNRRQDDALRTAPRRPQAQA